MPRTDLQGIVTALRNGESFLVTTHTAPDGDAIGGVLAVRSFLRALGKRHIVCACQDPVPRLYNWLPGAEDIVGAEMLQASFDVAVIIDVAEAKRAGNIEDAVQRSRQTVVLDHHLVDRDVPGLAYIDATYASASQIVLDLYRSADIPLTREAALHIYVGLATDTGGFRFANTDSRAHRDAADLLAAGVDATAVSKRVFETMGLGKVRLLHRILDRLSLSDDGKCSHSYLTQSDLQECRAASEDTDGLINYIRNIDGVRIAALFMELDAASTKVSMRAEAGLNAAQILKGFGGGGHAGAAGATVALPLESAKKAILESVSTALAAAEKPVPAERSV